MLVNIGSAAQTSSDDVVDLLLACHERMRSFTSLARAAAERSDAPGSDIVDACSRVERYFREALPLHVRDEEESIVPRLRGHSAEVDQALDLMTEQHARHEPILALFLGALAALRRDPSRVARRHDLAQVAGELEREFNDHLALEEKVIFPLIRLLSPDLQAEMREELRQRRDKK